MHQATHETITFRWSKVLTKLLLDILNIPEKTLMKMTIQLLSSN